MTEIMWKIVLYAAISIYFHDGAVMANYPWERNQWQTPGKHCLQDRNPDVSNK